MKSKALDRRQLLCAALAGATAPIVFARRASASPGEPERERVLVLIELDGGLDCLSALVPYEDDLYHRARPSLAVPRAEILPIEDGLGFPIQMEPLYREYQEGRVAIVQSVGRTGATMSHFKELSVWHEASPSGLPANEGWLGRLRNQLWAEDPRPELLTHIGVDPPRSLRSARHAPLVFQSAQKFQWLDGRQAAAGADRMEAMDRMQGAEGVPQGMQPLSRLDRLRQAEELSRSLSNRVRALAGAYRTQVEYPKGELGEQLRTVAALLDGGFGARVYSLRQRTYDKHSKGFGCTRQLFGELCVALAAFLRDLRGTGAERSVLVMLWSEFSRRVAENASGGTDHGAAGPVWFLGPQTLPGLHGVRPSLDDLDENGNLRPHLDFRAVYAAVLERWFGVDSAWVLGRRFEPPEVIRGGSRR